ncbi:MAG: translation elongation factor 4 [Candidatus Pacebacteria bacterium]|nr:translation elongation factor 4 [Candidatus Paceibacterota bacterium]
MTDKIRNFSIIAHIDHGKSTLADRLLEFTHTIEARKMRDQVLDRMDLERERGITIKMQPARMQYRAASGADYVLNLIDTPGHIDFAYEVSRALSAVEGVILLVDSTQGIQAQTLTTLGMAQKAGCVIIPVLSKIDSPYARPDEVRQEVADLLSVSPETVLAVSGRTGEGVGELLETIIAKVPAPRASEVAAGTNNAGASEARALIFDFSYTTHRGIAVYVRVFDGAIKKGMPLTFAAAGKKFAALETGIFMPDETPSESLSAGEIGYIVTGIKEAGVVAVGDTIMAEKGILGPLAGFERPRPVVWASVYPESQDSLSELRQALERLRLTDSSLSFEEESSGVLGRGFRCGFLGMLHLEIVTERLKREANLKLIVTIPTISYIVTTKDEKRETVYTPSRFPAYGDILMIEEPWVKVTLITPPESLSGLIQLFHDHEGVVQSSNSYADGRIEIVAEMPLRELMRGFFDRVKNVSSGYASLSYEFLDERPADVVRLDILVADEEVLAFARIVSRRRVQEEGEKMVEKLANILPRQLQSTKIQAQALGRIISSKTLSALRKDVTGYLYGGDVTRRMKLLEKQKKGKKHRAAFGKRVDIPQEVFMKMVQDSER